MQNLTHDDVFSELLSFSTMENLGKNYYQSHKQKLDFSQYLYLRTLPVNQYSLEQLESFHSKQSQKKVLALFHEANSSLGLSEALFFNEDHDIETEKLLRYIPIPAHKHQFIECSYVFSGSCQHIISGHEYTNAIGSFTIIPPGVMHELIANDDSLCLTVKIRMDTFFKLKIPNFPLFIYPLCFSCLDDTFIKHIILELFQQQQRDSLYNKQLIQDLFQILITYIMQNFRDSMQILFSQHSSNPFMTELLNYMYENYQTITLTALAEHFHFNASYLSNQIHKEFGKPFSVILRDFKLSQAANLLKTTDLYLNDICDSIGYKDSRQFIRNFKELYGITPAKYRKNFHSYE